MSMTNRALVSSGSKVSDAFSEWQDTSICSI